METAYEAEAIGSGLLDHIGVSRAINEHYPIHKNWQGGDKGIIVSIWLCYILTTKDHRLYTLESCLPFVDFKEEKKVVYLNEKGLPTKDNFLILQNDTVNQT